MQKYKKPQLSDIFRLENITNILDIYPGYTYCQGRIIHKAGEAKASGPRPKTAWYNIKN